MRRVLGPILVLFASAAHAVDLNEARFASVAGRAMMAQIVQVPPVGGIGVGDDNTWTGTNIFTTATTFGSAAAAANSFVTGASSIIFEGATADDFETTLTVTDPDVDSTFTIGYSPDGNPWIGATAGDSATSAETDNVLLGSAAGTALTGTATDNVYIGDSAGSAATTGDTNTIIGADAALDGATNSAATAVGFGTVASGSSVAIGSEAEAYGGSVVIGYLAGDAAATADADNVFIGLQAGTAASGTSTDNVCIGDLACDAATTGDNKVCVGSEACGAVTTAGQHTCVGDNACASLTDQSGSAFGYRALVAATGAGNVGVGSQTGDTITTGTNNSFFGTLADASANSVASATALGAATIVHATEGVAVGMQAEAADGVSIGFQAGDATAAADVDNVFIGHSAGTAANGTSTDNVCLGDLACDGLTTGDQNIVVGADADTELATDSQATALGFAAVSSEGGVSIGYQAGLGTATGSNGKNVLIGYQAGDASANAAFDNNVGIGTGVFDKATGNATANTIVGILGGGEIVAGDFNTHIGGLAEGSADLSGATSVGYSAFVHAANGTALGYLAENADGVSIGYQAGDATAAADVDNVFIGNGAGTAANGTSTDNVCVGDLACDALTTGDNNVLIGANTGLGTATDGNTTVVGEGLTSVAGSTVTLGENGTVHWSSGLSVALTDNVATSVIDIAIAQGTMLGGTIQWTVTATDASDYQSLAGITTIQAVNPSGTEVCTVTDNSNTGEAVSAGTLTVDSGCTVGLTDEVRFTLDADSSLAGATITGYITVTLNGTGGALSRP